MDDIGQSKEPFKKMIINNLKILKEMGFTKDQMKVHFTDSIKNLNKNEKDIYAFFYNVLLNKLFEDQQRSEGS